MIRNFAIGGVVGLLFMCGGFFVGMRFVHVPVPKKAVAVAATVKESATASRDAISIDALRKTSEHMADVNDALQARELAVAAREKKAHELEDELDAERAALDRSHAQFKVLYGQFEKRLQLVSANEADQLQRQMTIYTTMDPAEAADLLRSLDDGTIMRLFSLMDTKALANLVSAWKTKYPADSTRLLTALTQMGTVMPQDKITLPPDATAPAEANASSAPAAAPAPADANANAAPASDTASSSTDAPANSAPAVASPADDTASASTDSAAAPSASGSGGMSAPAQASSSTPDASTPDASSNSSSVAAPASDSASPTAPAAPAAVPLAPPPDTSTGPAAAQGADGVPASPSTTSLLGVPGETAAEAAEAAQRRSGRLSADISNDRAY